MDIKKKNRKSVFAKLAPYMGKKKILIPIAIILSACAAIINIMPFYYIWKICMELFKNNGEISTATITNNAWVVVGYSVLGIILYFIALMTSHLAAFEIEMNLKRIGFEKALNMPLGFFGKESSGKIRKVINDGASGTHTFLAHQLPDIAGAIITPVMILGIFFIFDWRLGLASLVPIAISFVLMSMMMTTEGQEFQQQYFDALEEMSSESVEYVRAIPIVKTFGQSVKSFTKFYNSINSYKELVIKYTVMWVKPYSAYLAIIEATAFFIIPVSILIINNNNMGAVISNFILYLLVAPQFSTVMMKSMYFQQQKVIAEQSIDRFEELFDYEEMQYPEQGVKFEKQDIEFKNVVFSYVGKKDVLHNINFKVNKGESLALVGTSGSGKTTIARLCARFWDVKSGEVLIGGHNIKDYSKEELMANIAFVFQNNQLFKKSILENITFGKSNVSENAINSALEKSRSKEIIDNLKDGLNTIIGKKGTYLSGGEQQRIAIARAFIKDAPIILLDEATAFADPENEHLIQSALLELSKGKTTIMIAHRMTTIKHADHIAVVDKGQIVEYGDHDALLQQNGLYKKMWQEYQTSTTWNIKKGA